MLSHHHVFFLVFDDGLSLCRLSFLVILCGVADVHDDDTDEHVGEDEVTQEDERDRKHSTEHHGGFI